MVINYKFEKEGRNLFLLFQKLRVVLYLVIIQKVIPFLVLVIIVYFSFRKPKKLTASNVISRALTLEMFFQKKRAIDVLQNSLEEIGDELERASIYKAIGLRYYKKNEYEKATYYFDKLTEVVLDQKFFYDKYWNHIIMAYFHSNQLQKANSLYQNLISRSSYDIKFKKIKHLEKHILS
jgi:tetratricopeptide (TPR) repeat protein